MAPETLNSLDDKLKPVLLQIVAQNVSLLGRIDELLAQNASLLARIAELEAKLGTPPKTPDNSSLPPSHGQKANAEPPAIKPPRKGRPGVTRKLAESPDVTRQCARVAGLDLAQVEVLAHQGNNEARWVILRHIVLHARRQQLRRVDLPAAIMLAHAPGQNPTRLRKSSDYSDRLLAVGRARM